MKIKIIAIIFVRFIYLLFLSFLPLLILVLVGERINTNLKSITDLLPLITDLLPLYVALLIGILGIFRSSIIEFILPPLFDDVGCKKVKSINQTDYQWYNLIVKNIGYSTAKNLEIRIREEDDCAEWINLKRPFSEELKKNKIPWIKVDLYSGQEEDFNIGGMNKGSGDFFIETALSGESLSIEGTESFRVKKEITKTYFLALISSNKKPEIYKMEIINKNNSPKFNFKKTI